jgi:hypothetical protein
MPNDEAYLGNYNAKTSTWFPGNLHSPIIKGKLALLINECRLRLGIVMIYGAGLRLRSVNDHQLDLANLYALILQYGLLVLS